MPYVWNPKALEKLGAKSWDEVEEKANRKLAKIEKRHRRKLQKKAAIAPLGYWTGYPEIDDGISSIESDLTEGLGKNNQKAKSVKTSDTLQQTDGRDESEKDEGDVQPECQGAGDSCDGHDKVSRVKGDEGAKEDQATDPEAK